MSIAATAAALLLLTGDTGQAAPRPQAPSAGTTQTAPRTPAAPPSDLTRSLNSGPPRPADYLAPPPEAEEEDEAPPARAAPAPARPSTGATAPRASAPPPSASRPATAAPATGTTTRPPAAAPSAPRPTTAAPATTTRPPAASAPSTTRPSTAGPAAAAPSTSARPPAGAPATARPSIAAPAATAPATAAPPAPGVTVLDAVARADLPFTVELPQGFEIVTGRPGSDFRIYTIRRGERSFVMVYAGPASQFPIYSGEVVEAGGRASVIAAEDGQRHALEHLFQRATAPREIHVWTMSLEGADRALAERIAQSVDLR